MTILFGNVYNRIIFIPQFLSLCFVSACVCKRGAGTFPRLIKSPTFSNRTQPATPGAKILFGILKKTRQHCCPTINCNWPIKIGTKRTQSKPFGCELKNWWGCFIFTSNSMAWFTQRGIHFHFSRPLGHWRRAKNQEDPFNPNAI